MSQPNVWIIDHRDSFTWNLAELIKKTGLAEPRVIPNDTADLPALLLPGEPVILSPGPGTVYDQTHKATFRLLQLLPTSTPVLGVCLGHQILGIHFGAELEQIIPPLHGCRATAVIQQDSPLFHNLPSPFAAGLYHSWRLSVKNWPSCLDITATDAEGHILGLRHRTRPMHGIQFHPESILTPDGLTIMNNFLMHSLHPA